MIPSAAHVTHEACEKIGGIGAVLEGILTSPVYRAAVKRSILVGPYYNHLEQLAEQRLGPGGTVLYSTLDRIDRNDLGGRLRPIEWAFNVAFIYGSRRMTFPGSDQTADVEVLLIDVFNISKMRVEQFKHRLWSVLGIDSTRYEGDWGYEEYVRLAEPAYYALLALHRPEELPCLLFSHEFMGLPTAFKAVLDGPKQFRTIFHAHECSTARRLVESLPGHDTAFYNILERAREQTKYVHEVFGDQSAYFRHALVSRSHLCDAIFAVGKYTAQEIHFLEPHFDHHHIDLVHNGIPAHVVTPAQKETAREKLQTYAAVLTGEMPDVLMSHVTRPVVSKGIWRDLLVCGMMDGRLREAGRHAVLFILTSAGGTRRPHDVLQMETEYGWPMSHREGYPDLVGPEIDLWRDVQAFNARHTNVRAVLVNQFNWSKASIGARAPEDFDIADFRDAVDVEFGMAVYEPFGISPLEPLGSGAVCVVSNVCGCADFVQEACGGRAIPPNVLIADFTKLPPGAPTDFDSLRAMTFAQRDAVETRVAREVAEELLRRVPKTAKERAALLASGQQLVKRMGWDHVLKYTLLPTAQRVMTEPT